MGLGADAGRIIHADNSGFFPSFFVTFENIHFTGGKAQGLGGAFFNQGKMQVCCAVQMCICLDFCLLEQG